MIVKSKRKKHIRSKVKPPKKAKLSSKLKAIKRKKEKNKRKNFLPTLVVTIILWVVIGGLIYFADPHSFGVIPLFLVLVYVATMFTFSIIFAQTRRGIITASALTLFLILRYLGIGNVLNLLLILGLSLAIEYYFNRSKS